MDWISNSCKSFQVISTDFMTLNLLFAGLFFAFIWQFSPELQKIQNISISIFILCMSVAVLLSAAEGYVQHVDHVAAGCDAEAVCLNVGSCHRQTV